MCVRNYVRVCVFALADMCACASERMRVGARFFPVAHDPVFVWAYSCISARGHTYARPCDRA